ncbi:TrmH family RNA methyltransferase [Leptospira sp. GIMC2001]|uniref:TrmH family RNA methyltransferase n=1 Tax=Leptospira sp. GIMC2001 TaxID=1513297 RepID=UPI002349EE60|nr:RNA methyltransferase [Leptospira sp. GIMC2001]WCL50513.1 RNA methyltransferase [Leptospira sp. GIMC2001]
MHEPNQKITSFSNPKVKYLVSLKERKNREKEGRFFLEGYREITRAKQSWDHRNPLIPRSYPEILCISPECFLGSNEWELIKALNLPIWEFPKAVFEKISHRDRPDGLILIGKIPDYNFHPNILDSFQDEIVLVIEGVEKPGNLGTILRTAEGAGVKLVIVTDPRTDIYSPNVMRSSTGILFTIPVYLGSTEEVLNALIKNKFKTLALTPEVNNPYYNTDLTGKIAIIFGSEQYGLSDKAKEISSDLLSIPMLGEADSLNLALSTGIVIYESLRQRSLNK